MESDFFYRIRFIKFLLLFLVCLLIAQLFRLQILEHDRWALRAQQKQTFRTVYKPVRGSFYFADGSIFAVSKLAYTIYALPKEFEKRPAKQANVSVEQFVSDFAELTGIKKDVVMSRISSGSSYVLIGKRVDPLIIQKLEEKYPRSLNIWNIETEYVRFYPNNEIGAKIIGFVRENDKGEEIGQYGVEQYFDGLLRGAEGLFKGIKDKSRLVIANQDYEVVASLNGVDITLTIDRGIQALVEEYAKKYTDIFKAKEATIVIIEPNTGRLLAVANYPTYNPNVYWEGELVDCNLEYYKVLHEDCNKTNLTTSHPSQESNDNNQIIYPDGYLERLRELEELQRKLNEEKKRLESELQNSNGESLTDEEKEKLSKYPESVRDIFRKQSLPVTEVYRNSANSVLYEPGSVMKVITLAIAYNAKTIPQDINYSLGGHSGCEKVVDVSLCTITKLPVSSLSVKDMLIDSDNVGALRVALSVPIESFVETYEKFGLGRKSGVELADEAVFSMKDPSAWTKVDVATASYGQGSIAFTPIQLVAAWNVLASGGKYYAPTIVKSINDNGRQKDFEPIPVRDVISEDAAKATLYASGVATSEGHPKSRAFYKKYPYAGKTGTADITKTSSAGYRENVVNTSYVGIAPIENPRFTMLVWFREPRIGIDGGNPTSGNTALHAWIDLAEQLMIKLNIPPKDVE